MARSHVVMINITRNVNKTMGEAKQRNHVSEVMAEIEKSCGKVNFDVQKTINGFDIHEFPSPFIDLSIGERGISFFSNNFK
jgi:hypothetical protein